MSNESKNKALEGAKKGFDGKKRWGNSAIKGHGVNSPAMMKSRAGFEKSKGGFVPMSKKEKAHSNKMYAHALRMREASERQHTEEQIRIRKERK